VTETTGTLAHPALEKFHTLDPVKILAPLISFAFLAKRWSGLTPHTSFKKEMIH